MKALYEFRTFLLTFSVHRSPFPSRTQTVTKFHGWCRPVIGFSKRLRALPCWAAANRPTPVAGSIQGVVNLSGSCFPGVSAKIRKSVTSIALDYNLGISFNE